jgi:hypothetical protein
VERDGEWRTLINILVGNRTDHALTISHLLVATDFLLCFLRGSNGGASRSRVEGANLPSSSMSMSRPYAFGVCVGFFDFGRQVGDVPVLFEKSALVLEVHLTEAISVEHGRFLFTVA